MNIRDHPFLYQWDTNRYLDIPEADAVYVDFARTGEEPLRIAVADGGVRIPDSWLQTSGNQNIYVCYVDGTLRGYTLRIVPRPKPPDYVATPDEAQTYAKLEKKVSDEVSRLDDRINNIPEGKDGITPTIGDNGNWYLGDTDTGKPSRGEKGDEGQPGSDGLPGVDGADGVGIQSVEQAVTSTEDGGTNIITVTKTDGTSSTFTVRNGSKGSTGATGATGAAGADGKDGKTAYQYAVEGGYTGTETEFAEKLAQEQLTGTTDTLTPKQVYDAVSAGIPVKVQHIDSTYGLLSFTEFNVAESMEVIVSQTIVYYNGVCILAELFGNIIQDGGWGFFSTTLAEKTDIPSSLPNPNALTIKIGSTAVTYDGSKAQTVTIDDGTEVSY